MAKKSERTSRRAFLKAGLASGAAAVSGAAVAGPQSGNPANQPPNVPDWTRSLGDGVAVRPYGKPSKFEAQCHPPRCRMAHRLARKLGELHAAARA